MAIDFGQVISGHAQALKLRGQRAEIIAANLAHVNTPGYQARDIDFSARYESALASRDEGLGLELDGDTLMYRVPHHPSGDANTVELGVEQAAFAQNATGFQTSLTFLQMKLKGLAQAIQGQ
ncbi:MULTISPECIES: flagellar basal body rod protein FlgB [Hydrogenophaga]|uniref:Flagellar basal body rod protein FlgB n=1 Tax=Hydrogenophaga intermedia TaxID=65786 RepID=A0A1L1PED5_HYDIT|nr:MULTISPECIES: flagellar basal body rod protein FlgB [Hydrogenophaga]AOS80701.1 flagellar basal-body rod protein FlgB [Hydrogenophaga sp. PBC]TMU78326.1 flagellar basal body rod protein FlgB [Hydrogenophaga intermedia]CDN87174.1 Flagellar basal body rod protein FlgB [Hydrogenophaga intermedia]